jgi:hypothetical protein
MYLMRMTASFSQAFVQNLIGRGSTRYHTPGNPQDRQMLM